MNKQPDVVVIVLVGVLILGGLGLFACGTFFFASASGGVHTVSTYPAAPAPLSTGPTATTVRTDEVTVRILSRLADNDFESIAQALDELEDARHLNPAFEPGYQRILEEIHPLLQARLDAPDGLNTEQIARITILVNRTRHPAEGQPEPKAQ